MVNVMSWIRFSIFLFPFSIVLAAGCSSSPHARLTVRPATEGTQAYSQVFNRAYVTRNTEGEYHVILLEDDQRPAAGVSRKPGEPLKAANASPVTQILYLRVFWRPLPGTRADHPSATNAALDWYVLGDGADRGQNLLHYSGAGFVTAGNTANGAKFTIRSAAVVLSNQRGQQMTDPIGPARVTGTITAVTNEAAVQAQVAQIRDLLAASDDASQASSNNFPPARPHAEP